jgi:hypothetical protein
MRADAAARPATSISAGQLLPVSGTPHAKAARLTPGSAATRSSALAVERARLIDGPTLRDGHRQDALGVVARRHAIEVLRGAEQQRRAGEQRDREHDLDVGDGGQRGGARRGRRWSREPLSRREAIAPRRPQRGSTAAREAAPSARQRAEEQHRPADRDGIGARHARPPIALSTRDDRVGEAGAEHGGRRARR